LPGATLPLGAAARHVLPLAYAHAGVAAVSANLERSGEVERVKRNREVVRERERERERD